MSSTTAVIPTSSIAASEESQRPTCLVCQSRISLHPSTLRDQPRRDDGRHVCVVPETDEEETRRRQEENRDRLMIELEVCGVG